MNERVLDELEVLLKSGYAVDSQAVNVDEFEPEDDPNRDSMRVKFRLGGNRSPSFFFTFDAQASVQENLAELESFVQSHAQLATTTPSARSGFSG